MRAELVVEDNGEERYAIRDIIGQAGEKDLGVENLKVGVGCGYKRLSLSLSVWGRRWVSVYG